MNSLVRIGVTLCLLLVPGLAAAAEPPAAAVLGAYLATDCEVGDAGVALAHLLVHAQALEPELIAVLRDGPDATPSSALRQEAEQAWERRAAFLATNPPLGLAPDHVLAVHAVDREAWIEARLTRTVRKERERAAAALAHIASPAALRALRQTRRADPALRGAINALLAPLPATPSPRQRPGRAGAGRP